MGNFYNNTNIKALGVFGSTESLNELYECTRRDSNDNTANKLDILFQISKNFDEYCN